MRGKGFDLTESSLTCCGSSTAPGCPCARDNAQDHLAFRLAQRRRRPGEPIFAAQYRTRCRPLSTLRVRPCGRPRMTRGPRGSLLLRCEGHR
jgi:hypothetical protein